MLKRFGMILFLSAVTAFAANAATPQQSTGSDTTTQSSQTTTHKKGKWMHRKHDPATMAKRMAKKLNLTSDQQAKVQSVLENNQTQAKAIRKDKSLTKADKRAKFEALENDTHSQIRAVLNPDQQTKFDAMVQKHERKEAAHKAKKNRGASNSAPSTKP